MTKTPILYLMLGYPGAGKTTVSEYIAELTGAVHINSDQFRLNMFKEPLKITDTQHDKMYDMLDYMALKILKSAKSVIYDANLNRYIHRQDKYAIAQKAKAKTRLIWVKTDVATARLRATENAGEHPGHRPFGNMKKSIFDRLVKQIELPKKNESPLIISGQEISHEAIQQII